MRLCWWPIPGMWQVRADAFEGLAELTSIDLSQCSISDLQDGAFAFLNNLAYLRLESNKIKTLSPTRTFPTNLRYYLHQKGVPPLPPHIWINENKRRFNEHTRFRHLFLTSVTSLLREPHLTVALHPCSSRDNVRTDVEGLWMAPYQQALQGSKTKTKRVGGRNGGEKCFSTRSHWFIVIGMFFFQSPVN